jgi:hypothetical protein
MLHGDSASCVRGSAGFGSVTQRSHLVVAPVHSSFSAGPGVCKCICQHAVHCCCYVPTGPGADPFRELCVIISDGGSWLSDD